MTWRILELFSGLGAWRWAAEGLGRVAAAYDISPAANGAYARSHGEPPIARELATIAPRELAAHGADTWLLSPPCQPYCRMGNRMDLQDRRSHALVHLVELLAEVPCERLALENVEGFAGSKAHKLLLERLRQSGFQVKELRLCPTRFGFPNQRPRLFLLASRSVPKNPEQEGTAIRPIGDFLDPAEDVRLYLEAATLAKHGPGLDLVRPEDRRSCCFIGGYGRRYVGSGSFLRTERGVRRFSPAEIARLLGFPRAPEFPGDLPLEGRYKLLGNSLNVVVARRALEGFRP